MVYETDGSGTRLESASFGGGRIVRITSTLGDFYVPHYFLTDHLGSTRVVVNRASTVLGRNDYFAFGSRWSADGSAPANRWQFSGKESQQDFGLSFLDFGFRMYLPGTVKWLTPDPLAGKYMGVSPYMYCLGSPINYIDPYGLDVYFLTSEGRMILALKTEDDYDRIYGLNDGKVSFSSTSYIDMEKSFMESVQLSFVDVYNRTGGYLNMLPVHQYESINDEAMQKFFEFAADNTNVEWGLVKTKRKSYLYTSHEKANLRGGGVYFNDEVIHHIHNHRNAFFPSSADKNVANVYEKETLFKIYYNGAYYRYYHGGPIYLSSF